MKGLIIKDFLLLGKTIKLYAIILGFYAVFSIMQDESDVVAKSPIVIDNGSGVIKAGFAGDEKPLVTLPS